MSESRSYGIAGALARTLECKIVCVILRLNQHECVAHAGEGARGPLKSGPGIESNHPRFRVKLLRQLNSTSFGVAISKQLRLLRLLRQIDFLDALV